MEEFDLPRAGDGDKRVSKFQLNLLLVFQDYLGYGFLVKHKFWCLKVTYF